METEEVSKVSFAEDVRGRSSPESLYTEPSPFGFRVFKRIHSLKGLIERAQLSRSLNLSSSPRRISLIDFLTALLGVLRERLEFFTENCDKFIFYTQIFS